MTKKSEKIKGRLDKRNKLKKKGSNVVRVDDENSIMELSSLQKFYSNHKARMEWCENQRDQFWPGEELDLDV